MKYPKRLIEVDLPIKRISAHARKEKSIRHGNISTLHIWWARRPLAACRAVVCAALWPDPADGLCPISFQKAAEKEIRTFARTAANDRGIAEICDKESWKRYCNLAGNKDPIAPKALRGLLLDFIADASAWEASTNKVFLRTARNLTQCAHESLGGAETTRPLVVDPFAGGGAIPLEALRVGADAFASDLNPVAVLLNKVVLDYVPKYGISLAEEVRTWGEWIKQQAERELSEFYPVDSKDHVPLVYFWARTITCEGPACGFRIPLLRSLYLSKKSSNLVALRLTANKREKTIETSIVTGASAKSIGGGTVKRSSVTCPVCGFTTPRIRVEGQIRTRRGGACDAQLLAVLVRNGSGGRSYRDPNEHDDQNKGCLEALNKLRSHPTGLSLVPNEPLPYLRSIFNVHLYGMVEWGDLFSPRSRILLVTLARLIEESGNRLSKKQAPNDDVHTQAILSLLLCVFGRMIDQQSSLVAWAPTIEAVTHTFGRQALGMIWDYAEPNLFADAGGSWDGAVDWVCRVIEHISESTSNTAHVEKADATAHPLPDDSASVFFTDPPYYDAVPYADLSDFFYVWHKRAAGGFFPDLFGDATTPKRGEIVQLAERNIDYAYKTKEYFEQLMQKAFEEGRRVLSPSGIGTVVFAHKTTEGWESLLSSLIQSGWIVTGSWPIDTERPVRLRSLNAAALASSVHLVCRPRENPDGSLRKGDIGDWRNVLAELPKRINDWLPRLAEEGVVGADAIFACLGPALEVFSRYSSVEKASGEHVSLGEYLEQVWAAVSKEALNMIFVGGDATGLEEDARLTAMWLWTLAAANGQGVVDDDDESDDDSDEDSVNGKKAAMGYSLEYDAARKIAQGLGAHLEKLVNVVEIKGDVARLLSVAERTKTLFGKGQEDTPFSRRRKKAAQLKMDFMADLEEAEINSGGWGDKSVSKVGDTVLNRLHQSMILFAAGRGEALRRFLVEEGIGRDQRFWRLAQALSALYPTGTDEKRWVDGVLARKKGLGF